MKCAHHPEYDPVSGEPKNTGVRIGGFKQGTPCPYCWQAYAKVMVARSKELEQKLVNANQFIFDMGARSVKGQ